MGPGHLSHLGWRYREQGHLVLEHMGQGYWEQGHVGLGHLSPRCGKRDNHPGTGGMVTPGPSGGVTSMSPPRPRAPTMRLSGVKVPVAPRAPIPPPAHLSVRPSIPPSGAAAAPGSTPVALVAPPVPAPRDAMGTRSQPWPGTEVAAGRGAPPGGWQGQGRTRPPRPGTLSLAGTARGQPASSLGTVAGYRAPCSEDGWLRPCTLVPHEHGAAETPPSSPPVLMTRGCAAAEAWHARDTWAQGC